MKNLVVILALLLCSSLSAAASGVCNNGVSSYFGYCKTSGPYTSVQGTLLVPLITYNGPPNAHGATDILSWIGIGTNLAAPVQTGIAQQLNSDGSFSYQAWTGAGSITLIPTNTNPVLVGDQMTFSIVCTNCVGSAGSLWDFTIDDVHPDGTSWHFTRSGFSSSQTTTWAQWLGESPVYGGGNGNIPNFGIMYWYNALLNGSNPSLVSGDGAPGVDPALNTYNPSAPISSGDGFAACYGTGNAFSNCDNVITLGRTIAGGAGR